MTTLSKLAELLRQRADSVEVDDGRLWVVATGRRTTADLMAIARAHGFHAVGVEPVITGDDSEEVFSFLVTPYRLYTASDLRKLSGFTDGGYLDGVPHAARRCADGWCILAQPANSPHLVLFRSRSLYTWRLHGTEPVGTGLHPAAYVVLDPADPHIREQIQEFVSGMKQGS